MRWPSTTIAPSAYLDRAGERPVDRVVLEELGEQARVGDVVDRHPLDVGVTLDTRRGTPRDRCGRSR